MSTTKIDIHSEHYPLKLKGRLGAEAPKSIEFMGNLALASQPAVGFCGSRKATDRGLQASADCAKAAAQEDLIVVSGNASGVDIAAHESALANGGSTILVLSEGIDRFRIRKVLKPYWDWSRTLVISQWPSNAVWRSYQAMARNNTIIGLSDAMAVIEAGLTGGTRHAGEKTLVHGVPLFVVEYRDMSEDAAGNADLISMGGVPIRRYAADGRPNLTRMIHRAKEYFAHGNRQEELNI